MACVDGSQSIRLGSNSAQIPGLLSQTKPLGQPEPQKQSGSSAASAAGGPPSSQAAPAGAQPNPNQVRAGHTLPIWNRSVDTARISEVPILCAAW